MSEASLPTLNLVITPKFDSDESVSGLDISLSIDPCEFEAGSPIVAFPLKSTSLLIEIQEWDDHDSGGLAASFQPSQGGGGDVLIATQTIRGKFQVSYHVSPSAHGALKDDESLGLHFASGGVLGSGLTFIPIPLGDTVYRNLITWDLSKAPSSTRAVWTYGEGPKTKEKIAPASILSDSVYMVGPIQSFPTNPLDNTISDYYGYYWFSDLPPNIRVIQEIHHDFVIKIAEFFSDPITKENPYRSFVRHTGSRGAFGGTSFTRSHIFDYDDRITQADDYDLVRRMSYEMSHNWLGPSITITTTQPHIDWFYEGLKNCLSVYFPFRNRFRTGHYFQSTISMLCTRYYTNPLIHLPHHEVVQLAATDVYASELLSARAWAFAVGTDLRARRMTSELVRPVEDLAIKPLAKRSAEGQPHGVDEWLAYLQPVMGTEAEERYEEMLSGATILLDTRLFGAKTHYLKQVDQEVLDFGMDRGSFRDGVVRGLKQGSRAQQAGLGEGDVILRSSYEWRCLDHFQEMMDLVVVRDGVVVGKEVEVEISYWPRSFVLAKSWQMVEREREDEV